MENDSMSYYQKGKSIVEEIEKYTEQSRDLTGEDKDKVKEKIAELNKENDKLKDDIYKQAKEKSGLDYSKEDKNPEVLKNQYNEQLSQIKKRKQELRLEKIRIEKLNAEKENRINEQFKIASEKYKMMLDAGKITQELYDSRIESMDRAKVRDLVDLHDPLENIEKEYVKLDREENDIKTKISELEKKEIIFNEYGDVYYRLFGEVLSDRDKIARQNVKDDNDQKVKNNEPVDAVTENGYNNGVVNNSNVVNSKENSEPVNKESNEVVDKDKEAKKEEPDVVVTSKAMFNELYKKMKKGTITDKEMNALVATLEDPSNYDKYGITTGLVFNKAKKILKYQGARTAKSIDKFLRDNSKFSDDIKFNTGIEKDNVLSHDILNSWKNIDEKLTYTDAVFSVEKYINQMEKYKESGAELTKEQEQMLKSAMDLKKQITSYRKAINTNEEVGMDRSNKTHNSIFYRAFSNKIKSNSSRALPERNTERTDPGFIVMDFGHMVNSEPAPEEITSSKTSPTRERDKSGPSL